MKLLSLEANKSSFNPVEFNPSGLSIIAAVKKTNDKRKTYNSLGKSLTISLIHFCLGSNPNKEFEDKLPEWEFYLKFEVKEQEFVAKRATNNQKVIFLNDTEYTLDKFKAFLAKLVFEIPENSKFISFRGLISRFIRPSKYSYNHYNKYIESEDRNIAEAVNNAFLLGLDIKKILKKSDLKKSLDDINQKKSNIEKDDILKSFFKNDEDGDVEIEIVELEAEIKDLSENLEAFRIAEDYYNIQKEADEISIRLKCFKNRASKLKIAINNVEKSLDIKPDISKSKLVKLYNEANIQLGDMVLKRLKEVESFNKKLLSNRSTKLIQDKERFEEELSSTVSTITSLGRKENEKLQYLNAHGALDEYTKLNKQLADKEKRLEKIQNYKKLLEEYQEKIEKIEKDFIDENADTRKYLNKSKTVIDNNILLFKSFVNKFYSKKSSGIAISSNTGTNRVRYDINAKISDDSGDSVNEVKIFCYDWTILKGQHNHNVRFLFHDSRITDGLDIRQLKTLFEVANKESKENNFQYIISLNEFSLNNLKSEMSDVEGQFEEIVEDNIILRLSDKSDAEKLLGIQVDLNYDK